MIIREFLYVDNDRVRSLLAQLHGAVPEHERAGDRKSGHLEGADILTAYREISRESYIQRSLAHSVFPLLEDSLEEEGMIADLTTELRNPENWGSSMLSEKYPPGSIVRITAKAVMFDARYISSSFAGLAATWTGINQVEDKFPKLNAGTKKAPAKMRQNIIQANNPAMLEDEIPDTPGIGTDEEMLTPHQMRAFVKIARGMFTPGLHFILFPSSNRDFTVSARLQEGRQYLDTDPDVLFARYGTTEQTWTAVGSIGHYPRPSAIDESIDLTIPTGGVVRARAATLINALLSQMGALGFVDQPQAPGFSIVPFAVYREIQRRGAVNS
jgi:hypothetical protein